MPEQRKTLLVELDCLLDTRLATLHCIDPLLAKTVFDTPAYFTRDWDDWSTFTQGQVTASDFATAYAQRGIATLKAARPTGIVALLKKITHYLDLQRHAFPDVDSVEVVVNTHPYPLSQQACRTIETLVYRYCHFMTKVTTTQLPFSEITPLAIKTQWDAVILYDFDAWFHHHGKTLNTVLIPRNQLIVPRRYRMNPQALIEDFHDEVKAELPFDLLQMACVERVELVMLPLKDFSILRHTSGS